MRFRFLIVAAALATLPSLGHAEAVGVVTEASGGVRLLRGETYLAAQKGVDIEAQDILETDADASVQVDLEDGSSLRLGPGSRLVLSEYRLDNDKSVIAAGLDLLTGWLRFAVSSLKRPEASYRIHAPTLTLGIRGTEGVVEAEAREGALHLETGVVEVGATDLQGQRLAPVRVTAGEYIHRPQGRPFTRLASPPRAFRGRLPPHVQRKIVRRALAARERGVPPRVIRAMSREDATHFIERHPHAAERLRKRFQPHPAPGARRDPAAPGTELRQRPIDRPRPPGDDGLRRRDEGAMSEGRPLTPEEWRARRDAWRAAQQQRSNGSQRAPGMRGEADGDGPAIRRERPRAAPPGR